MAKELHNLEMRSFLRHAFIAKIVITQNDFGITFYQVFTVVKVKKVYFHHSYPISNYTLIAFKVQILIFPEIMLFRNCKEGHFYCLLSTRAWFSTYLVCDRHIGPSIFARVQH